MLGAGGYRGERLLYLGGGRFLYLPLCIGVCVGELGRIFEGESYSICTRWSNPPPWYCTVITHVYLWTL